MIKRIIAGISAFVLAAAMLCGCSFFSHDYERDLQQEIAVVESYSIVNEYLDEDGEGHKYEYTTPKKTVYKRDLVEYVQNNADSLAQQYQNNPEGLYNYAATMLVNVEIIINEVDALIAADRVEWDVEQQNVVRQNLYSVIDNSLFSQKNAILDERGYEQITSPDSNTEETSTTYPVKPEPTDDGEVTDDEVKNEVKPWAPDRNSYPATTGDSDARSLDREAMRRFVALLKSRVNGDFRLEKPERKWLKDKIDTELKEIDNLIDTQGVEAVYPVIGSYSYPMKDSDSKFGYIMYYLSGESIERSQKILAMQNYLIDSVTVQYQEVADKFNAELESQTKLYSEDIAKYDTAMSGNETVLYHANSNYFYVKHILLPFSDDQKASLEAFKNRADIKNLQDKEKEARVNEFRAALAESIVCYPHKDGEDDKTKPMSVDDVMAHIRSVMTPLVGDNKKANSAFNDLIYLYNTDTGAFGNDLGYVVKYELGKDEQETYMTEFAEAARYMRDNIEVGSFYDSKVITDYGVHLMYLSSIPKLYGVKIDDPTSPDGSKTFYDVYEEPIRTARENAVFESWQNNILTYNYKKHSTVLTENFSDLWED